MRYPHNAVLFLLALATLLRADAPTSRPSTHVLDKEHLQYTVPAGWHVTFTEADEVPYLSDDDLSCFVIKVLPRSAAITAKTADGKVEEILADHKKQNEEVLEPPLIERDPRFALRIHERYRTARATLDELWLYRPVGNYLLRLDMGTFSHDVDRIVADRKVAEQILLSFQPANGRRP